MSSVLVGLDPDRDPTPISMTMAKTMAKRIETLAITTSTFTSTLWTQ